MWERRVRKCRFFFSRRCLSLLDYQSKASRYRKELTYLKNRATTYNRFTKKEKEEKIRIIQKKIIKPQKEKEKERDKEEI